MSSSLTVYRLRILPNTLDRSVVDLTGLLSHCYIFTEMGLAALKMGSPSAPGQDAPEPLPPVFTAIQELDLSWIPKKEWSNT